MGGRFLGEELGLLLAPPIQRRRPGRRGLRGAAGGRGRSACRPSPPLCPQPRPDPQCRPQQTRLSRATPWPLRGGPRGRRFPNVDPKQIGKRSGFQGPLAALTPHPTRAPPLTSGAHSGPSATSPPVRGAGRGAGPPPRVKSALLTATFAPAGAGSPPRHRVRQTDRRTDGGNVGVLETGPALGGGRGASVCRQAPGCGGPARPTPRGDRTSPMPPGATPRAPRPSLGSRATASQVGSLRATPGSAQGRAGGAGKGHHPPTTTPGKRPGEVAPGGSVSATSLRSPGPPAGSGMRGLEMKTLREPARPRRGPSDRPEPRVCGSGRLCPGP